MNTNFKVIGLIRLGIKPVSTAQGTDALNHSAILSGRSLRFENLGRMMGESYNTFLQSFNQLLFIYFIICLIAIQSCLKESSDVKPKQSEKENVAPAMLFDITVYLC